MIQHKIDSIKEAKLEQQRKLDAAAIASIAFVTLAETGQLDDTTATEHIAQFEEWVPSVNYKPDQLRSYNGKLYRCLQAHTSQTDWTPSAAASLWEEVGDPTAAWPEWSQPIGAVDAYALGDKVSYDGKHWTSTCDANVWAPGVYGWTETE